MAKYRFLSLVVAGLVGVASCNNQSTTSIPSTATSSVQSTQTLEEQARAQLGELQSLMALAKSQNIDVTREETIVWFAEQFLKFANWDEANQDAIQSAFSYERYYAADKVRLAAELPDFERQRVIDILVRGIDVLRQELNGEIKRRPVRKVDWKNTIAADNMFLSNGKPIFPYDYFSKSVGQPLSNTDVYNDHLGAIYHGGENLYPVDHDRAINSFLLNEDGTFNQELMSELTNIPDTNIGFLIYWLMGIPEWAETREPEIRSGRSLFTGFDIDNPLAREIWRKIIQETGKLTVNKRVTTLGYILANEPHWFAEKTNAFQRFSEMNSISSYTRTKFRAWLNKKYAGDISALNDNWRTSFNAFSEVDIEIPIAPARQGTPLWYDWSRYNMDRSTEWFSFMQNALHEVNPEANTHVKIWPRAFTEDWRSHGIDVEALTELTTMIGHDAKALGSPNIRGRESKWTKKYAYYWGGLGVLHDFVESVSPDKINVNSESHFLSSGLWRDLDPRTSYVRSVYWLATLLGMDANMGWFWARDPDGSPEDRLEGELNFFDPGLAGAYAGSVNMQPHVANEVTQVMFDLNSFSEEIITLRKQRRPVRLFYSETSAINTNDYMTKGFELYEALFFEGFSPGYATKNIIEKQSHSNWDVIVVFNNPYVNDAEFTALQSYLDAGGTIILDSARSLSMNEYGAPRTARLSTRKGSLIVMDENTDVQDIKEAALVQARASLPDIRLTEENGTPFKGSTWRSVKLDDGSYLVNILNLGKTTSYINIKHVDGASLKLTDLMTGQSVENGFELTSEGVILLQVFAK